VNGEFVVVVEYDPRDGRRTLRSLTDRLCAVAGEDRSSDGAQRRLVGRPSSES